MSIFSTTFIKRCVSSQKYEQGRKTFQTIMERRHAEELDAVTRLHEAAITGNVATLVDLLNEHPLILDQIIVHSSDQETPLHVAAISGHIDFVGEILSRKKELAMELDAKGCSPLHLASAKGNVQVVKKFLSKVEPSSICELKDGLGRTPLHVAAMKGRDEVVKELIDTHLESTRVLTYDHESVLHVAVKHNRFKTLKLLLGYTGHVDELLNTKDCHGNTILHLAVEAKQVQTVKSLVGEETNGLDVNASNNNGCTPLDLLLQSRGNCRDMEIAKLLQDHGARRGSTTSTMKGHDEWVRNMSQSLMIVASLIATVAFTSIISPAGGVFQQNTIEGLGPSIFNNTFFEKFWDEHLLAGVSIMSYLEPDAYEWYYGANTTAFLLSVAIILLLVSGFSLRRRFLLWVLTVTMWAAILALVFTYFIAAKFASTRYTAISFPAGSLALLVLVLVFGNILRLVRSLVKKCKRLRG